MLIICGCGSTQDNTNNENNVDSWHDIFAVSNLKLENNRISVDLTNRKDVTYDVVICFELKSGDSVTEVTEMTTISPLATEYISSSVGVYCLDGCDEVKIKDVTYNVHIPLIPEF